MGGASNLACRMRFTVVLEAMHGLQSMAIWIYGVGLLKGLDLNSRVYREIVYFYTF